MKDNLKKIILASASPRRSLLLEQIGLSFSIVPSKLTEVYTQGLGPFEQVQKIALAKASDVAQHYKQGLIIAADTIVVLDNQILGKPRDHSEAILMLHALSGQIHQVLTGIAIVDAAYPDKFLTAVEQTKVKFRTLSINEIKAYVETGEPFDKAGAYGIQGLGALLVEGIEGCYFNVVGLPLTRLAQGLKKFGVEVL